MTMTEPTTEPVTKKPRRKYARRKARPAAAPVEVPAEFEGLTAKDCCNACNEGTVKAEAAQKRMNEIDRAYPRQPSRNPMSETVMENDAEWLARNPSVAEEWQRVSKAAQGVCAITEECGCAHPFKGGLTPRQKRDPRMIERYTRAKKTLEHQKVMVRG